MPLYNIAGITLDFTYQCDAFFKNNIEHYLAGKDTVADYTIKTEICDTITAPVGHTTITHKNRSIVKTDHTTAIVVRDESGDVRELVEHTPDYKSVHIKLARRIGPKLAEQEYVLTGLVFMELATLEHRLAIHGSAFIVHEEAIVIAASSGTGKSTHAAYWKDVMDDVVMINDDKPLIHIKHDHAFVSGSPWSGKAALNTNREVPLKALVFYHQGTSNHIQELTTEEKVKQLMNHAIRPRGVSLMNNAITIMDALVRHCPMFEYHGVNAPSSVQPLYQKLYGGHS